MFQLLTMAVLAGAAALGGCSPALDWREVRVESTPLKAMMPCKPEQETRPVTMAGRRVDLHALVCRAEDSTFALLSGDVGGAADAAAALQQWKAASLAGLHGASVHERRFHPPGGLDLPQSVQVVAAGTRPDGSKVESQAAYFARGSQVFQAVIYTPRLRPELADPFFAGLRFE